MRRELVISVRATPLVDPAGAIVGGMFQVEDVTEQARAADRTRSQFNSVPVPTFVWQHHDRDGADDYTLADFNKAANTMSHGRLETLRGKWLSTEIGHHPSVFGDMAECRRSGSVVHRIIDHQMNTTGEDKILSVTYCPVPPDLVLTHTEDVTQRVRLETELRHAQKLEALGRLAAGVAHDFNNLLTVIDTSSVLALEQIGESSAREDLVTISDAVRRATTLTRQLLAFSRRQVVLPQITDLNPIISELEPMLRRLLGHDIQLDVELDPVPATVLADPGQLEQVIINLVVNSRDAMDRSGRLVIRTSNAGNELVLTVADTGHGMDAMTRARIFEPFFTTKEAGRGTGLGLSTVAGIVEAAKGTITVDSEPGRGTTFEIRIPRVGGSVAPISTWRGHGETILVAEDQVEVRAILRRVLEAEGYSVLDAINAREAILIAQRHPKPIDLLLTDLVMPDRSGRDLYKTLGALRPDMRVLFMAYDDDLIRRGVNHSATSFLTKPFTPSQLLNAVAAIVSTRA
jgi:nitrogen-specific signal transduction histidine kinase